MPTQKVESNQNGFKYSASADIVRASYLLDSGIPKILYPVVIEEYPRNLIELEAAVLTVAAASHGRFEACCCSARTAVGKHL